MRSEKRSRLSEEELQEVLDQLDKAMLARDAEQAERIMQQVWSSRGRLPEALTERLTSGRAAIPGLALELLTGFAGHRSRAYLKKIAESTTAEDFVRITARRHMGWARQGEAKARRAFLYTLRDDVSALVETLHQATQGQAYPPDGETFQEVLNFLMAMPVERAVEVVTAAAGQLHRDVAWLLRGLLHSKEAALCSTAARLLLEMRDVGAQGALDRAATASHDPDFAAEVQVVRQRLSLRPAGKQKAASVSRMPPLHSAYLSSIDGDGGQAAIILRERGEDMFLLTQLFFKDGWGVKDTFGINVIHWDQLEQLYGTRNGNRLATLAPHEDEEDVDLIQVDLAAVRGAVAMAVRANIETSHALPPRFEIWEPLLHDQDPPSTDEKRLAPELDDAGFLDRADLYRQSGNLHDHPFFQFWFFNAGEIAPLLDQVPRPVNGKLTDRQFRPLIEMLVDEPTRLLLRDRLRRQAWLLRQTGDRRQQEIALAAAAKLARTESGELGEHPFLRSMILRSLENLYGVQFSTRREPNPKIP